MSCETCNAPIELVESNGGTTGHFEERWQCANGHEGWIEGQAEDPVRAWDKRGAVFKNPTADI